MQPGQILVADHDGVYIIKMEGDVRLTLCVSFDQFIDTMFSRDDFTAIVFDLTEAEAVDSTTLGLMAKIAILAQERRELRPMILSNSAGINRTLDCMGFAEILDIYSDGRWPENFDPQMAETAESLTSMTEDEAIAKQKVLEAHRILMDMNDKNRAIFQDLVKTLEND
jgi:anti-anti-sigma factor